MRIIVLAAAVSTLFVNGVASAQPGWPEGICGAAIAQKLKPGLYYPNGVSFDSAVAASPLRYSPSLQLVYIPRTNLGAKSSTRVVLIKTRTAAMNASVATRVQLQRRPITTVCPPGVFPEFASRNSFSRLNEYIEHHKRGGKRDPDIGAYFHFRAADKEVSGDCFATDDPDVVPVARVYGLNEIKKYQVLAERFGGSANAAESEEVTSTRPLYAGLKSELVHLVGDGLKCVAFQPPLPSYEGPRWVDFSLGGRAAWAVHEASKWRPLSTLVEIIALNGTVIDSFRFNWGAKP